MKTTTQKTTASAVAKTPATKALTAKQIAAQAAKSAAFFAEQEAAKPAAPVAQPETPHLDVPVAATVSANVFSSLVQQAEKAVVEVINSNISTSFEAELAALQAKHGVDATVKYSKHKTEKTPRAAKIEQNGITRPAAGTLCGLIWSVADNHTTPNQPAQISAVRADAMLKDVNHHTIKTQYARWRKFNGVTGRLATVTAQPVGQDAGLVAM